MESDFLRILFGALEREADYLVIRNYETLPETVPGTDIDIVVRSARFRRIRKALLAEAPSVGYALWKSYRKNFGVVQMSFAPEACKNPGDIVRVDFILDTVKWLGVELMDRDVLRENRFRHNGIWALGAPPETALTLMTALLYGSRVKEKYLDEYRGLGPEETERVDSILNSSFGRYGGVVVEALKNGRTDTLGTSRLRYAFIRDGRDGGLLKVLSGAVGWFRTLMTRLLRPPGLFVVLVGPDGCGKSTINDLMQEKLKRLFSGVAPFHLFPKPGIFSPLDRKSRERYEHRRAKTAEWELRRNRVPVWKSALRAAYQLTRFWAGYVLWIYPRLVKGHLVIGERWCYDILFDPASKGIDLSYSTRKLLFRLCRLPGRTIVLTGSARVMAGRKAELPEEEISRQIKMLEDELGGRKNVVFIDSTVGMDETFLGVLNAVVTA